ncbi:lysylphosphatidylglycerol synthase transmembrane domain-containing protein [Bosea sp. LjRoot9]|uniref:lysylphosphatidylglycerol synthase transmembrane domain-containing protein n=1 Tax=Bosea sp. LjRoot9 TaxID=3342341 RepID=UPI003ECCEA49
MNFKKLIIAAKLVVGAAFIGFILYKIDIKNITNTIYNADLSFFALSIIYLSAAVIFNALRWVFISRGLSHSVEPRIAIIGYFEAMFFNQILPTGFGGDAIRIVRAYDSGIVAGWATIGVLIDRAFGLLAVGLVLLAALVNHSSQVATAPTFPLIAACAALIVGGAAGAAGLGMVLRPEALPGWTRPFVVLLKAFADVFKSPKGLGYVFATLIASSGLTVASFMACANSLGVQVGWWDCAIILQGMVLASLIPISIGGWGLREGAAIILFGALGIGTEAAAATSILFGLVLTVVGLIGAAVWMFSGYRRVDLAARLNSIKSAEKT